MSKQVTNQKRRSVTDIRAAKSGTPLVVLTAYTAPMAALLDDACDILMVGDSLGMVVYGYDSTLKVSLEQMIAHGDAVVRHSKNALVVIDLPFGSYQASAEQAFHSAARVLKETGATAVKLEGGKEMAPTIAYLVERGIPVMAHVGLMPQHLHQLGGFKAQGKEKAQQKLIMEDALAVEKAGAFSVVLEGIMEPLAKTITQKLSIPTIGIGASPTCDGQVLVVDDMLGMFEFTPRFVKPFAELRHEISRAASEYAKAVRARKFPTLAQCYGTKK
ncbi:MAG: 3-methyl-2-oxobutanoate hydroxymethyltransferase [Alphaproteobacteria bacterium]|nr:3-methyl-2-oxobutanoate hydroxymethyltransferase [Alphaproteobacteria bacterium]